MFRCYCIHNAVWLRSNKCGPSCRHKNHDGATGTQQLSSDVLEKDDLVYINSHTYYGGVCVKDVKIVICFSVNITNIDMCALELPCSTD